MYMYSMYVICPLHTMRAAYKQYVHDLTTHAHLDTFIVAFLFRILWSRLVMNVDTLNTPRRATKPSQDKEDRLRRWRE